MVEAAARVVTVVALAACAAPSRPAVIVERPAAVPFVDRVPHQGFTGRVVLEGVPIRYFGVTVAERAEHFRQPPKVIRNADGRFTVAQVSGRWDLIIAGPDFARHVLAGKDVEVGKLTDLGAIEVRPGFVIQGQVIDPNGRPIADAVVSIDQDWDGPATVRSSDDAVLAALARGAFRATTDVAGFYMMRGVTPLDPRQRLRILARTDVAASFEHLIPTGNATMTLTVMPSGVIAGRATGRFERAIVVARPLASPLALFVVAVDTRGAFRIEDLPAGDYDVMASGNRSTGRNQRVSVVAGETTTIELAVR